jgi:hypothetical protein
MHQERNVAESIISMVFDLKDKTKDNFKARQDLVEICVQPTLILRPNQTGHMGKPRAKYYLKPAERKEVLLWLKNLKFPYGYAANLKRAVNIVTGKMNGLKSHDYHIIMERLLPVMSDPGLWDCVHNIVHAGLEDRTCPIPYLYCTLLACEVGLAGTEGNYSSCTRV